MSENENAKPVTTTRYIVLRKQKADDAQGDSWGHFGSVEASSADAAIRSVIGENPGEAHSGVYVAVPARSFKAVPVKIETQTAVKFG